MTNLTHKPIKCILITHGKLGEELKRISEKILEQDVDVETIGFEWGSDAQVVIDTVKNQIHRYRDHQIIILTDMFGGSPSNICFPYIGNQIEVISGINLPGLLKFLTYRHKELNFKKLVNIVKQGAIDGINIMGEYLGEKTDDRRKN